MFVVAVAKTIFTPQLHSVVHSSSINMMLIDMKLSLMYPACPNPGNDICTCNFALHVCGVKCAHGDARGVKCAHGDARGVKCAHGDARGVKCAHGDARGVKCARGDARGVKCARGDASTDVS